MVKITNSKLFRLSGFSSILAGLLFIIIQFIHPADVLASVTTDRWVVVHIISVAMCIFGMLGVTGIYARQAEEAGWLGLLGYVLFSLFYAITLAFQFVEAFVSPLVLVDSPKLVESLLALANGSDVEMNLGNLATAYMLVGGMYLIGGLLFGIAMYRAKIVPRSAAILFALGGIAGALATLLLPHPLDRSAAVPMGAALVLLGYALLTERRR